MHRPKMLVFFLCLCVMTQSMLSNGLIPVNITTLEKRFNLNSAQSGLFTVFYDIAIVIVLIPVCHWGNKGEHKVDTVSDTGVGVWGYIPPPPSRGSLPPNRKNVPMSARCSLQVH
jgi:hypothetical protein